MPARDGGGGSPGNEDGTAEYVFRVRIQLEPRTPGVRVDPATFETTLLREADPPGHEGWLFFRDNLWRGEINDQVHFRDLTEEALGVTVLSMSFRELRTDSEYLEGLKDGIAANLELFKADDVPEVLNKYLGSAIHVRNP